MAKKFCTVCGEDIRKEKYFTEYKGKKYYFCSQDCLDEFESSPEEYLEEEGEEEDWN